MSFDKKAKMSFINFIESLGVKLSKLNSGTIEMIRIMNRSLFEGSTIGVHQCSSVVIFLIVFVLNTTLFAREVTFLPAYVVGEEPPALKKKDNLSTGVSELIGYYANENFIVEVSDPDKVKTYISELGEEMDRKPSRSLLNGVCEEFSSDFIVKSEINFDTSISILSEVYNCRGKVIASNESLFKDNFYLAMEKHTKKTLSFLVPKNKTNSKFDPNGEEEIIFLFDLSGSLAREVKAAINYIQSITGSKNLSLGAVIIMNFFFAIFV
jgi:hypothetical protein